ncbi:hypothetical protein CEY16_13240 [Halalkalibacillus sediminis]|uniref:DUF1871 domain-containing protein n=1 Tax=Halalkalibacillus sediminis TaxID=2018042 RepID=A0A2I0QR29_9BACI|nr:hypothetical protein [Halalkalibacillus sediminis]PKR76779.1 hypothetical protein CEY16_13240 [Halalkalibacillus sediminis]
MSNFYIIKSVIDKWDPLSLLHHAPADEYEPEVEAIDNLLSTIHSEEALAVLIHKVFVQYFGDEVTDAKNYSINGCRPVAKEIWSRLGTEEEF